MPMEKTSPVDETRPFTTPNGDRGGVGDRQTIGRDGRAGSVVDGAATVPATVRDVDQTLAYVRAGNDGRTVALIDEARDVRLRAAFADGRVLQERYLLERELGRGGMGLVYLGRDTRLDRPVAVKVILAQTDGSLDENLKASFAEEARLGAKLTHPAIATVFDYGFHAGNPFTIFEYIPGETLRDVLERRGRLPLDEARLAIATIAQALDFAHERHVVHRDLKPENIRATEQGQFKVLDLGLAKDFHRHSDWTFCGTPAYASPEQAANLPCDGRTDQYALALIAFEMLTGRRPFVSKSWVDLLSMHVEKSPPRPQEIRPDLPDFVGEALLRALAKDPNRRYETCTEFAVALGCQLQSAPAPLPEVLLETDFKRMAGRWKSFNAPFSFHRPRVHLTLAPDALWATYRSELMRWPLSSLSDVSRRGRKLRLRLKGVKGKDRQTFNLSGRKVCRVWYERLVGLVGPTKPEAQADLAAPVNGLDGPKVEPVVLLKRRPATRFQLLGSVEVKAPKARLARGGLVVRGAMMGADAVVDLQEERLTTYWKTEHRAVGTAVRAVDQEGRLELKSRWFDGQVRSIGLGMIVMALLGAMVPLSRLVQAPGSGIGIANLVSAVVVLALALAFGLLRWPQLARPAAVCFFGMAVSLVGAIVAAIIGVVSSGQLVGGAIALAWIGISVVFNFAFFTFYYFLARRAWHAQAEYRRLVGAVATRPPVIRRVVGGMAITLSALCACWVVGHAAWTNFAGMSGMSKNVSGAIGLIQYSADDDEKEGVDPEIERARKALKVVELATKLSATKDSTRAGLAGVKNNLAWPLATSAVPGARRPAEALALATQAVEDMPDVGLYVNTLGVAQYAVGDYDGAINTLNRSMKLRDGGDAHDFFFLAMAHARKGDRTAATGWYERGVRWLAANKASKPKELARFRADAAGLVLTPPSPEPKPPAKPQGLPVPESKGSSGKPGITQNPSP
jgi:serine/threonine protein kinase